MFWEVWISAINAKPFAFPWGHWLGRDRWMSDGIAFHQIGKWEVTCKHQYLKGGYYIEKGGLKQSRYEDCQETDSLTPSGCQAKWK